MQAQTTYYQDQDYKYPEIAILLEDISWSNKTGKFFIPILTPIMSSNTAFENKRPAVSKSNIINRVSNISGFVESNFVELTLPEYLLPQKSIDEDGNITPETPYKKNDKFIIVFVGGDINKIRLIGVY